MQSTQQQDSIDFLRQLPVPTLPEFSTAGETQSFLVKDSQTDATIATRDSPNASLSQQFSLGLGQFQTQQTQIPVGSAMSPSKFSEVPEPTQDAGFETLPAPISKRDQPYSTIETVMAPVPESPLVKKKGKLRRRAEAIAVLSDDGGRSGDESDAIIEEDSFELTTNAFDALFKAAKKPAPAETFDKNKSEAKKMVEEQAEESEDEYAGLGGASDDESTGEVDEEMQMMIDEGPVDVDESKLAKFYADKERAEDEKRIDKLYKDITTGLLRRKRGADLDDLSDSDDEAEERRRRKQREFAKMRKALLEDENIGKIGESSKP
jgi:mediator of replication checkpoint protein 1